MSLASTAAGSDVDRDDIDRIIRVFFGAFVSGPDTANRMTELAALFMTGAVIVRTCGGEPTVYDVEGFVAPRAELLGGGELTDFSEWPLDGRLDVFGDIAQWFGAYAKKGVLNGTAFEGRGKKSLQFVRTSDGWRISAAAWDDERENVSE